MVVVVVAWEVIVVAVVVVVVVVGVGVAAGPDRSPGSGKVSVGHQDSPCSHLPAPCCHLQDLAIFNLSRPSKS